MPRQVKPIPKGYHAVTPYLIIAGAADALKFYKKAFRAKELLRIAAPGGRIGHAELQIGDSRVMISDEYPAMGCRGLRTLGGSPVALHLYVEKVDQVAKRAIAAGAKLVHPVEDKFYGDRMGSSRTRSAMSGTSRPTRRTCRPRSCAAAPRPI
jgi:PhnB protein